jgi:hypothetical protein
VSCVWVPPIGRAISQNTPLDTKIEYHENVNTGELCVRVPNQLSFFSQLSTWILLRAQGQRGNTVEDAGLYTAHQAQYDIRVVSLRQTTSPISRALNAVSVLSGEAGTTYKKHEQRSARIDGQ